jgi:hypothetical protein
VFFDSVHDLLGVVTVVGPVGGSIVVVAFGKDEDIVATAEWISEDSGWAKVDVGIVAGCLVRGRPIEVPDAEAANVLDLLADGRRLTAKATITVDPNVLCLDLTTLVKLKVALEEIGFMGVDTSHWKMSIKGKTRWKEEVEE